MKYILLFLFLIGCYHNNGDSLTPKHYTTDPELIDDVQKLEHEVSEIIGKTVEFRTPVVFDIEGGYDWPDNVLAVCITESKSAVIIVNNAKLELLTQDKSNQSWNYLRAILLHEFGHCDLKRDHDYEMVLSQNADTVEQNNYAHSMYYGRSGERRQFLRKSIMWPTISKKFINQDGVFEEMAKELFDPTHYPFDPIKIHTAEPNNTTLPMNYRVYNPGDWLILETGDWGEYNDMLFGDVNVFLRSHHLDTDDEHFCDHK